MSYKTVGYPQFNLRMKKCCLILLVSLITGFTGILSAQNRFWVAAGASNWNNTANWSTTSGGAGGASVPGTGGSEVPVFNANGLGNCNLDIAPLVPGITVNGYTGTIDLLGNNLTTTGTNLFTTGTISNTGGAASVVLNTTGLTTFNGTLFTANISGSSGRLLFNGSTFNGTVAVTKTVNTNDDGTGNNTFGNSVTLTNASSNRLRMATTTRDIFNGALSLISNGTGALELGYSSAGTQINNNVTITYTLPGTISFGASTGTSTLATGQTITISGFGGSGCGNLYLGGLTQSGATPQTITLAGNTTATLSLVNSNFAAAVALTAPRYGLNGSTFQGAVTLQKTDGATDNLTGGNTFQSTTSITNTGSGELNFGNTNPDIFNNNLTLTNTATGRIQIGLNAAGNIINGNLTINHGGNSTINAIIARNAGSSATINGTVTLNNTNTVASGGIIIAQDGAVIINGNIIVSSNNGRGVYFGNASGSVTQTSGNITSGTFSGGDLSFSRFTQTSTAANALTLTGSNTLSISNSSVFGGDVNFRAPLLTTNGTTFNGAATLEKTGGTDNYWGGNTFEGATTITNSGSAEIFMGNTNADTFNDAVIFNNTGSYRIRIAHNHNGQTTTFANSVTLNSNKSGGTDQWSFLIGENANSHVTFMGSLTINVAGTLRSDHRFLNGPGSIGTFNGPVTINETNTNASTVVTMGVNGTSAYAENIVVNNPGGTNGVTFNSGASASSTLASGKTITIGGGGFTAGTLNLFRFTQTGPTAQTLTAFSGTSVLVLGPNTQFGGNVNFTAPRLFLNGVTVAGTAALEKNGASDDAGTGGNVFQGVTTITHSGSGYLLTGNTNADQFGATTTFNVTGSGRLHLAQNHGGQTTTFASDVTFNSNKSGAVDQWGILFCEGTNTAVTFGGNLTIQNAGSFRSDSRFLNGVGSTAVYSGTVTVNVTNTNSATVQNMGTNGQSTFNENIIVSNSGGANGVYFNSGATSSSTLAAGKTITLGAGGFTSGNLSLQRFTQIGATAQSLNPTGTANLIVGPASQFDGNVSFISPRLHLNGCTYGGTGTFEKTGDLDDAGTGGNIFTGVTTITNSGLRYLLLGNGTRDQFLNTTTFNNTGSYRIYFAFSHAGQTTEFASDLILNTNKSGGTDQWSYLVAEGANTGISVAGNLLINCAGTIQSNHRFLTGGGSAGTFAGLTINLTNSSPSTTISMGENGTSTYSGNISVANSGGAGGITFNANAAASSTLNGSITSGVFSSGSLNLYRFTQAGAFPQTLTLTNNGTILRLGPNSSFDGDVTFVSPRLLLNGATYNGTSYLEKNGNTDDNSNGGNIFNGSSTLVNSGSGYLLTANTAPDIANGDIIITNSGSNYIYLAYNVPGNQFNGNITLNNTGSALGIRFSHSATGAATFNAGIDKTISVGGSGFSVGELGLRRFTQTGSAAQTLTLTGSTTQLNLGPSSEFNGNVTFTSPRVFLNGTRYNGTAFIEKTGANADDGIGGNTFNQPATLVNSGSSYLLSGSTNPDIFNGTLTLHNNSSSTIRLADNSAGNQFNGNIELNSTSGGGIYFGNNVNGTSTLAAGRTIAVGSSGFLTGDVRLLRFTQVGPTPQTLNLGGIAILTLGPSSSFGGDVDFRSPQLLLNGTTFSGTSYLEKKGAVDNYSNGGNTFVGSSTLVHSGSGYLAMAQFSPDVFQSDLIATNTGSNIIYLANNVPGNAFNGNITFNSTLGSGGIYIGNNGPASATLGNGASLLTGGLGFSSGELRLKRLTQIGSSAQTLTLTGTALLRIGPASTFNGNLDFRAPQIALDGAVYNGITYLEKTGAGNNDSAGGNSFLGATTTIANSGTGFFRFAITTLDTFGAGDLHLINTGTSTIRMADNVPGTVFNGNIFVNSTFGGGIYFSESGGGTATLAAGKAMSVGTSGGFTTGELRIRRFTQADAATPQTLLLTGTAGLVLGPTIAYNGNSDFRAPQVFMNGGTFNGPALIEKTGATDNSGTGNMTFQSATTLRLSGSGFFRTNGGNTFNGATSIINTGSNYMLFELVSGSTYNGDLTMTNTGSSRIRVAYTGASAFNGNIIVNSTNGSGIYFVDSGTGSATLAAGRTISVGGTGFTVGELSMPRFTQTGATAQNLVLTGTSTLRTGPATTWNGNFTSSSPLIFLDGTTFNGTTNSITKTGATTDGSVGGNTFAAASTSTLVNSGTGVFRLATATADDFAGNVVFNQIAGTIQPAYNIASTFRGDVTVTSSTPIVFGANNGGAIFTGTTANQNVSKGGTASPTFRRLTMNKASGTVTMNTDAAISITATFISGVIHTTAANYLNFENDATTTGASNASFVDGPVRKTGNDAFTFPIGDGAFYRPAAISAPTAVAHYFIARYFNADHGLGSAGDPLFTSISKCEYWTVDRNPGVPPAASNVLVTLSWQEAACVPGYITDPTGLRVARWNGASWVNHGNGGTTGTATNGTIVTSGAVTAFSPFTLASAILANPLPVELTSFTASVTKSGTGLLQWHTAAELNNDRFEIERSVNGVDFTQLGSVDGSGTTNRPNDYQFEDTNPVLSLVYYRLKQVDFDGEFEYSSLVPLDFTSGESNSGQLTVSPNPINSGSFASFRSGDRTIIQSVTVYNSVNQIVRQYSEVQGFSTEGLAPGIYIVRNKGGEIFRLVIK
jgi:hypothetical protein